MAAVIGGRIELDRLLARLMLAPPANARIGATMARCRPGPPTPRRSACRMPAPPTPDPSDPTARFVAHLTASLADDSFVRLLFGRHRGGAAADLRGVSVRRLALRGADGLSFVHRHATRDVTRQPAARRRHWPLVRDALLPEFAHAHLVTTRQDIQFAVGKKGRPLLRVGRTGGASDAARAAPAHDREKHRFLDLSRPFLAELGVTDAEQRLIPAMSRKWKQINKFVEILDHALATRRPARTLVRCGCSTSARARAT